jgi:hypothetical protein
VCSPARRRSISSPHGSINSRCASIAASTAATADTNATAKLSPAVVKT